MQRIIRAVGVVIALVGLVAAIIGGWFVSSLGTSGTATFKATPGSQIVVLEPTVLNRVDHPIRVTATAGDAEVWMGTARPSDVTTVTQGAKVTRVTGVEVQDWALTTATDEGDAAREPRSLDVWQGIVTGVGPLTTTIEQEEAPQTLVVAAPEGSTIDSLTFTVSDDGWFTKSLILLIAGLILLVLGIGLAVRPPGARRRTSRTEQRGADDTQDAEPDVPVDAEPRSGASDETSVELEPSAEQDTTREHRAAPRAAEADVTDPETSIDTQPETGTRQRAQTPPTTQEP
ncbi:hypothetical protein [Janibacter sp. GXQ6167]|uniref:hypothetical protein n=1 Tax=Janibacter sp. GXQ6167 TaxID=3240791 RepID=UPI0035269802